MLCCMPSIPFWVKLCINKDIVIKQEIYAVLNLAILSLCRNSSRNIVFILLIHIFLHSKWEFFKSLYAYAYLLP